VTSTRGLSGAGIISALEQPLEQARAALLNNYIIMNVIIEVLYQSPAEGLGSALRVVQVQDQLQFTRYAPKDEIAAALDRLPSWGFRPTPGLA
jgi:hypothetical protein